MKKRIKIFATAILLVSQFVLASPLLQQTQDQNLNDSQNQQTPLQESQSDEQVFPNMNDEESYLKKSQNRIDQLNTEMKNMKSEDQKMNHEGYDPNEKAAKYSDSHTKNEKHYL